MVKWQLVGFNSTDGDARQVAEVLKKHNIEYNYQTFLEAFRDGSPLADEKEVFVFGPINIVNKFTKDYGWLTWMPLDKLKCSNYYPIFGDLLTQQDYLMMPAAELGRHWNKVAYWLGSQDLFIRPDGNGKRFTGEVMNQEEYLSLLNGVEPDVIVMACYPKKILKEWRILMVEGQPVTGSVYRPKDERMEDVPCRDVLEELWFRYSRSDVFGTMPQMIHFDIALEDDNRYSLLEISAVNAAGLYEMDLEKAVLAMHKQAEYEYGLIAHKEPINPGFIC